MKSFILVPESCPSCGMQRVEEERQGGNAELTRMRKCCFYWNTREKQSCRNLFV